jgi:hypothetical protein
VFLGQVPFAVFKTKVAILAKCIEMIFQVYLLLKELTTDRTSMVVVAVFLHLLNRTEAELAGNTCKDVFFVAIFRFGFNRRHFCRHFLLLGRANRVFSLSNKQACVDSVDRMGLFDVFVELFFPLEDLRAVVTDKIP